MISVCTEQFINQANYGFDLRQTGVVLSKTQSASKIHLKQYFLNEVSYSSGMYIRECGSTLM